MWYDSLIDSGIVPDFLLRAGVKAGFSILKKEKNMTIEERQEYMMDLVESLKTQPAALRTTDTRRQHYEVPTDFFKIILGNYMKYSSCLWIDTSLDNAEIAMLELTAGRAEIKNGMTILDLGCGWGSLSIYLAQTFPDSRITAVSHSATQKMWIDSRAADLGLDNLRVITADMNDFDPDSKYDRIVSIEMFEHMRNYRELFRRVSSWLEKEGRVFIHIFTTSGLPYFFDADSDRDWMGRNFFAGGIMPSADLFLYFPENLTIEKVWAVDGRHYEKTLLAWLSKMDNNKKQIMPVFEKTYGDDAKKWWNRWRLFFLSCAAVFGYREGKIWYVSHYLFKKK